MACLHRKLIQIEFPSWKLLLFFLDLVTSIADEALQQLDNLLDEEIEIEDILDDNDTTDSEEEEEVNSDVDYTELLRPMVTKEIPVSVDFSALEQLKGTLNEDVKWTNSNNPFAEATPVEGEEIQQAQTRTQRGRDAVPTSAGFNKEMEAKFLELWAHGQNPSSGAAFKFWCHSSAVEYEQWRNTQLLAAESEKKATPPLFPVTFEPIRAWVVKIKDISGAPLRDGAFNDKSAQLSRKMNTFAPTTSRLENLRKGAAFDSSTLQVNVAVAARGSSAGDLFDSPTLSTVQKEMPHSQKSATQRATTTRMGMASLLLLRNGRKKEFQMMISEERLLP